MTVIEMQFYETMIRTMNEVVEKLHRMNELLAEMALVDKEEVEDNA